MRALFLLPVMAVALSATAGAEMVRNAAAWNKLTAAERASYAAGFVDGQLVGDGSPADIAYTMGVNACIAKLGFTGPKLADIISAYYRKNPKDQAYPPGGALLRNVMRGPCLDFINAERKKYKLDPLTKSDG